MRSRRILLTLVIAWPCAGALEPVIRAEDLVARDAWLAAVLAGQPTFSYRCAGIASSDVIPRCRVEMTRSAIDADHEHITRTWHDAEHGLVIRQDLVRFERYPTVQWTLDITNVGTAESPAISDIAAVDVRLPTVTVATLHAWRGSTQTPQDFQPVDQLMTRGVSREFTVAGGRPSSDWLPYFNLDAGSDGLLVAIGWPGKWSATVVGEGDGIRICGGMMHLATTLHPGECIRTPLIALQWWHGGDAARAQNVWRRWMLAEVVPRPGGRLPSPTVSTIDVQGGLLRNAAHEIAQIEEVGPTHLYDYWWMDAGWYPTAGDWTRTGTWEPDPARYPHGVRAVSNAAHAHGMKTLLWFEPERATDGSWLQVHHDDWLLHAAGFADHRLLDLGNPEAWRWVLDRIDGLLVSEGIDLYRQDFNIEPLAFWSQHDQPGRAGMTELRHTEGYLALWDELRRRHATLLIDSCASGGRRNDLESMRRAVPLLRSDAQGDPLVEQCHTYGLASWLPYQGSGLSFADAYTARSGYLPWVCTAGTDPETRRNLAQWRRVSDLLLADFWPLTPWSDREDACIAWQYDNPDLGRGVIQAFRRRDAGLDVLRLRLRGLEPEATYELVDDDTGAVRTTSGQFLLTIGLAVSLPTKPYAALISYTRRESREP